MTDPRGRAAIPPPPTDPLITISVARPLISPPDEQIDHDVVCVLRLDDYNVSAVPYALASFPENDHAIG